MQEEGSIGAGEIRGQRIVAIQVVEHGQDGASRRVIRRGGATVSSLSGFSRGYLRRITVVRGAIGCDLFIKATTSGSCLGSVAMLSFRGQGRCCACFGHQVAVARSGSNFAFIFSITDHGK